MRGIIREKYWVRWFLLFLLSASLITPGRAQNNPQLQFDRANDQLESGDFRQALSIYKTIRGENNVSGSLYLNMAISYVQLDSLGKAKYYFLKAREFDETKLRAEEGLEYVESNFSRQSAVLPKLPWERFFDWLGENIGSLNLLGIGILLLNLGIYLFIANWFFEVLARLLRISGISVAAVSVLFILSGFYVQYLQHRYSRAVMVEQQAQVLEQPASDAGIVSQAYEGYTFTIDRSRSRDREGWSYVRMSNGLYGWIPNKEIMVL